MRTYKVDWFAVNSKRYPKMAAALRNKNPADNSDLTKDLMRNQCLNARSVLQMYKKKYGKAHDQATWEEVDVIIKETLKINDVTLQHWHASHNQSIGACGIGAILAVIIHNNLNPSLNFFRSTNCFIKDGQVHVTEHFVITHLENSRDQRYRYSLLGSIKVTAKVSVEFTGYQLVEIEMHSPISSHEEFIAECLLHESDRVKLPIFLSNQEQNSPLFELLREHRNNIQLIPSTVQEFSLSINDEVEPRNITSVKETIRHFTLWYNLQSNYKTPNFVIENVLKLPILQLDQILKSLFSGLNVGSVAKDFEVIFDYLLSKIKVLPTTDASSQSAMFRQSDKLEIEKFISTVQLIWCNKIILDSKKINNRMQAVAFLGTALSSVICNYGYQNWFGYTQYPAKTLLENELSLLSQNRLQAPNSV